MKTMRLVFKSLGMILTVLAAFAFGENQPRHNRRNARTLLDEGLIGSSEYSDSMRDEND